MGVARCAEVDCDRTVLVQDGGEIPGDSADHEAVAAGLLADQAGDAAGRVAAGAGLAAVGIMDAHEDIRADAGRLQADELVAADAKPAVRQMAHARRRQLQGLGATVNDDEIVPRPLHLHEGDLHG
jgi:hypothetical protein